MPENPRYLVVHCPWKDRETIARYLPANYKVIYIEPSTRPDGGWSDMANVLVEGKDVAGWTLKDYVIPRLGSGLFGSREIFQTNDADAALIDRAKIGRMENEDARVPDPNVGTGPREGLINNTKDLINTKVPALDVLDWCEQFLTHADVDPTVIHSMREAVAFQISQHLGA
jgi:hypothetical protein